MPAKPLEPGEWRQIRCYKPTKDRPSWLAVAQFRDPEPPFKVRQRSRTGRTRGEARTRLETALEEAAAGTAPLDKQCRLRTLWEEMLSEKRTLMVAGARADGTLRVYESHWKLYIEPVLGDTPITWLTVRRVDTYLKALRETLSYAVVKGVRTVLTLILDVAVRQDLIRDNPVPRAADIRGDGPSRVEAIPAAEAVHIWYQLQKLAHTPAPAVNNRRFRQTLCDQLVPDLWLWMLGTGHRIAQALAVMWPQIDLDTSVARVGANVTRVRGKGLVVRGGSSKSQLARIGLPEQLLAMLLTRRALEGSTYPRGPVFPDLYGGLLDPSNVSSKKLRPALIAIGRPDVSSRDCRRVVASELNEAGLSLMDIAAQLTHADTRTTERHYTEKRAVNPRVLDAINHMLATQPDRRVVGLPGAADGR